MKVIRVLITVMIAAVHLNVAYCLNIEEATGVVGALQRYHGAGCIFLVAHSAKDVKMILRLRKKIAEQDVSTAVLHTKDITKVRDCRYNRPLFVLLETASLSLLKQPSVLLTRARWLLLVEEEQDERTLFQDVHVPFDCELVVARGFPGGSILLSEVYSVLRGQGLYVARFGTWSASHGLVTSGGALYRRRNNLHGAVLQAVLTKDPPFEVVTAEEDGSVTNYGFFSEVWHHLESRLNFTTKLMLEVGRSAGSRQNGSWTGMVGMMQKGEALLSYNRVTMSASRADVLRYTQPVFRTKACVFLRMSTEGTSVNWKGYLHPFSSSLWLGIALVISVLTAVFAVQTREMGNSLLFVWSSFCAQGYPFPPRRWSSRLVFWITHFTSVTLLASYSARLISHLAVYSEFLPFRDLEGLLRDGRYSLTVTRHSGIFTQFQNASDPIFKETYQKMLLPHLKNLPEGRLQGLQEACRNPFYAFMAIQDFAAGFKRQLDCELTALPSSCFTVNLGLALAPDSGLRDVINFYLQEMRHMGLLRALNFRYWPQNSPPEKVSLPNASLQNVLPLLVWCAFGSIFGTFCLVLEIRISNRKTRRNVKKKSTKRKKTRKWT